MPTNVQFTRRSDNVAEKLIDLDKKMCAEVGAEVNPKYMNAFYDAISLTGIAILMRNGEFELTEEALEKWITEHPDDFENWDLVRKYLVKEYRFTAWYGA